MHLCTPIPSEMLAFELNADGMLEGLPALLPGGHGVAKRFFFLKYGHFEREREREREREIERFVNCLRLCLSLSVILPPRC